MDTAIQIAVCISVLLYVEEGWKALTGTRLPTVECYNGAEQNAVTAHQRSHRSTSWCQDFLKDGRPMGVQQHQNKGRRQGEGSLHYK